MKNVKNKKGEIYKYAVVNIPEKNADEFRKCVGEIQIAIMKEEKGVAKPMTDVVFDAVKHYAKFKKQAINEIK